ncbi:hypothetical protein [Sediminispirochaeta bajacaliforniensis]|uniref:hypothetical protein n=1 Tax=Sediminispirochaeta bajacaliforniensis TaxID=148 RepID=UPI000369533B|nr:hypothetical protein [Sediminispirochaeta bajacaliforniensis]
MARSLTGDRNAIYRRLRIHLAARRKAMAHYRELLNLMNRSINTNGFGDSMNQYLKMEQELLDRLNGLQGVIVPLRRSLEPDQGQKDTISAFDAEFIREKDVVFDLQSTLRQSMETEMKVLSRRIASLHAMPFRPPAFPRVDEPSRFDMTG